LKFRLLAFACFPLVTLLKPNPGFTIAWDFHNSVKKEFFVISNNALTHPAGSLINEESEFGNTYLKEKKTSPTLTISLKSIPKNEFTVNQKIQWFNFNDPKINYFIFSELVKVRLVPNYMFGEGDISAYSHFYENVDLILSQVGEKQIERGMIATGIGYSGTALSLNPSPISAPKFEVVSNKKDPIWKLLKSTTQAEDVQKTKLEGTDLWIYEVNAKDTKEYVPNENSPSNKFSYLLINNQFENLRGWGRGGESRKFYYGKWFREPIITLMTLTDSGNCSNLLLVYSDRILMVDFECRNEFM